MYCFFVFKKLTYWRGNVVKLSEENTDTKRLIRQTVRCVYMQKANELENEIITCLCQSDKCK